MKFFRIILMTWVGVFCAFTGLSSVASAATVDHSNAGYIDGVTLNPDRTTYSVSGWACAKNNPGSIDVDLYFGGPYGVGTYYGRFQANKFSEPAVAAICLSTGSAYRFSIFIDNATAKAQVGKGIFIHGINPWNGQDGVWNTLIANSGNTSLPPLPVEQRNIRGYVEKVDKNADGSIVVGGWACVATTNPSIQVDLYAGGPFGTGTYLGRFTANSFSETAIAGACSASGSYYRFAIPVSAANAVAQAEKSIWMHGINPFDATGASNLVLPNSGNVKFPPIELIRDPLAKAGVIPYNINWATIPLESSNCRDNWTNANNLTAGASWYLMEVAQNTLFCKNPNNSLPVSRPFAYRSGDPLDLSKSLILKLDDPEPSIEFSIDTSKELRQGCNLALPDNTNTIKGWNWPHLLISQKIQNPEAPGALPLSQYNKITLNASVKIARSQRSGGECAPGTWETATNNHEYFYLNLALASKAMLEDPHFSGGKRPVTTIYALVQVFYSETGTIDIMNPRDPTDSSNIIDEDPQNGNYTYFAPNASVGRSPRETRVDEWVNFSVDVKNIANQAIAAYNTKYRRNLPSSSAADFNLAEFYMGFEVWGAYKTTAQVKNLSMKASR